MRGGSKSKKGGRVNRGWWQMQRERLRLDGMWPEKGLKEAEPIGQGMDSLMKKLGMSSGYNFEQIAEQWAEIVGCDVAAHCRPGAVERGALIVFVDSSSWLNELSRYGKKQMLDNVQKQLGSDKIKSVVLRIDPGG